LLRRDDSKRPQVYMPAVPQEQTQRQIVRHLIQKVFGGSAHKLVLRAVESEQLPPDEVAAIRTLLKKMEGGKS
jgi:predicted transcriptional regulator